MTNNLRASKNLAQYSRFSKITTKKFYQLFLAIIGIALLMIAFPLSSKPPKN